MDDLEPVFQLPPAVKKLWEAQRELAEHYEWTKLKFTFDGRLVGDIAEAVALEYFELEPPPKRTGGVDALVTGTNVTVQVKATGREAGPAFTSGKGTADRLLFMRLDFETGTAKILYNGPEAPVRELLPPGPWEHTVVADLRQVRERAALVPAALRLTVRADARSRRVD